MPDVGEASEMDPRAEAGETMDGEAAVGGECDCDRVR